MQNDFYHNYIREVKEVIFNKYNRSYYKCNLCDISFWNIENAKLHAERHLVFEGFKHYFFDKEVKNYYNIINKYKNIIGIEGAYYSDINFKNGKIVENNDFCVYNKKLYCRICGMIFDDFYEATLHIIFHGTACYEQWVDYVNLGKNDIEDFFENYYNENFVEE